MSAADELRAALDKTTGKEWQYVYVEPRLAEALLAAHDALVRRAETAEAERDKARAMETEALDAWQVAAGRAVAAEARVAELEAERDEALRLNEHQAAFVRDWYARGQAAEARVAELTEALRAVMPTDPKHGVYNNCGCEGCAKWHHARALLGDGVNQAEPSQPEEP